MTTPTPDDLLILFAIPASAAVAVIFFFNWWKDRTSNY